MRLFVALPLPQSVAQSLLLIQGGVPGARWQSREQLHLTLRFIGEVDNQTAILLDEVLAAIHAPAFDMQLHAVGQFGGHHMHSLWAAVRPNEALQHLQRKVDSAIRKIGQPQDAHKFTPHVTLARLRHPEPGKAVEWLAQHALYTSPEFTVGAFQLYSSKLTSDGSIYRVEQDYPLEGFFDEADN
jgi:2'-5' RNA ligase